MACALVACRLPPNSAKLRLPLRRLPQPEFVRDSRGQTIVVRLIELRLNCQVLEPYGDKAIIVVNSESIPSRQRVRLAG